MEPLHDARGQATSEYVALVALVTVVLTLAAGLTSGGLGGQVLASMQHGLCRVTGGSCPRPQVTGPDLAPCPLERSFNVEELNGAIAFVRLASNETLTAVRGSDGRVTVMLASGSTAGGELGVGASASVGDSSLGATARGGIGGTWTSGRAWTFAGEAAARDFVAAYRAKATVGGKLVDEVRSRCSLLCDALGWRPHPRLPEPDETYSEGGTTGLLKAAFGLGGSGKPLALDHDQTRVIGRRIRRDGTTTWYLRLTKSATDALELPFGRHVDTTAARSVVSFTIDPQGRPATFDVLLAQEGSTDGRSVGGRDIRVSSGAGRGAVVEIEESLDLHDLANRAAAAALLETLRDGGSLGTLAERAGDVGARLARHGQIDRRIYAVTRSASSTGATVGLGLQLGAAFERSARTLRLLSAETRLPGLPFLPRDDCRPA